ncbi:hypothetical protein [Sinorhizobium fredii]
MNCFPSQASDLVDVIYHRFLPYAASGMQLAPQAVTALLKSLLTIRAIAREQEEEMRILEHEIAASRDGARNARAAELDGGNVVRFPARPRSAPDDGGDVA